MKQSLLLVFLLLSCGKSSFPPPLIPASPTAEDWPDVGAAILDDVATLELRVVEGTLGAPSRVEGTLEHRRRYKVLSEHGLKAAEIDLPIDGFSRVTRIEGRIVRPDGSTLTLEAEDILPGPWPGATAPELKRYRFRMPGAVVGGLIDLRYTRVYDQADFLPPWLFGGQFPVKRAELSVILGPGIAVDYRFGRGDKVEELLPMRRPQGDGRERLLFVLQYFPPHYLEPDMPHMARLAPWLMLNVTAARFPEGQRRFESWDDARNILSSYMNVSAGGPENGTASARYREVRDSTRYAGVPGLGVLPPKPPQDIAKGEPVSSRDAAARLLGALQGLAVPAHPALISAPLGAPAIEGFASFAPFVRVVVAVRAADLGQKCDKPELEPGCRATASGYVFLDPSCRDCRFGELPWELGGGKALILKNASVEWVELPVDPPTQHRLSLRYTTAFDSSGRVTGNAQAQATGQLAAVLRAAAAKSARDVSNIVFGEETNVSLHTIGIVGDNKADEPLVLKGELDGALDKLQYESFQLRPEMLIGPAFPGAFRQVRRYDALLDGPREIEHEVALNLPVGYEVDLIPDVTFSCPFATYVAHYERRARTLVFRRKATLTTRRIPAAGWGEFLTFLDEVSSAEQRGVRIRVRE